MFEIIGLLIATVFLFALAAIASAVLGLLTWLILRGTYTRRKRFILAALLLPIATAAWFWACAAVLPGESLFGDISEPLPNGFTVKALGKMPDYGNIEGGNLPLRTVQLPDCWIGKIGVDGSTVAGQCSHSFDGSEELPPTPYFIFDTEIGRTRAFATEAAFHGALGRVVNLEELRLFRSPLAVNRRRIDHAIAFLPPTLALLLLWIAVLRERYRAGNVP